MAEYQITSWRDIPSMVVARDGDDVAKVQLAARFQEAIDEAAMRLGETSADEYIAGWKGSGWAEVDGEVADVVATVSQRLEEEWTDERLNRYLDDLNS